MNQEGQLFSGIVFIVLCSMHPYTAGIGPVMIANLFLILGMIQLMDIYIKKQAGLQLYNFGLCIGVASVFYIPVIWFLLLGFIALILIRGFSIRELFQILSGWVNIAFLFFVFLYVLQLEKEFYHIQIKSYFNSFIFSLKADSKGYFQLILLTILFVYTLIQYNVFKIKKIVITQKYYDLLFWAALISGISLFFMSISSCAHFILWITPISILLAHLLAKNKNPLLTETIHLIFALSALFLQIQNW